jgi:MFS family permease
VSEPNPIADRASARDAIMPARSDAPAPIGRPRLSRNVYVLAVVSFFTDVSSEMIYPLLPAFLTTALGASASFIGGIEGAAESTAALLKLASGWWSDRVHRRKPLVVFGYGLASIVRPLVAIATSASQVLAIRVTDRIGKGIRNSPRDALIADSVDPSIRGRAFGFHRAGDNAGGVVGPLVAFSFLTWGHVSLRHVFWFAAIPAALAMVSLVAGVKEVPRHVSPPSRADANLAGPSEPLGGRFWGFLFVVFLFTLGNSTDAFLLLRAQQLGVAIALAPILWAFLHIVKTTSSTPGGALSDRIGRKPTLIAGWLIYAAVYFAFGRASATWHAWALFAVYGLFFGLTEGTERAFVSDLVPGSRRGTAFGWYYLAIGLGALPASVLFGELWDHVSPRVAFDVGASLALAAAAGIVFVRRR